MRLSIFWLVVVFVLAVHGHLLTAAFFAFPWFAHRRWEKTIAKKICSD